MSRLDIVSGKFEDVAEQLPRLLETYERLIESAPQKLSVIGKTLEEALKEQAEYPHAFLNAKAELEALRKFMSAEVNKIRSQEYRKYEQYSRSLSDRAIDKYIDSEEIFLLYNRLYLEIDEMHGKITAVCDAFTTRGFALRDVTQIRINQIHTAVL